MYYVTKHIEVSGAHRLELDYPSKCTQLHGHNWQITIYCRARELDRNGMVMVQNCKQETTGNTATYEVDE